MTEYEKVVKVKVPVYHVGDVEAEVRLAYAIDLFLRGVVSLGRAAELANMHIYDFIMELRRRGLFAFSYSEEEVREELGI
ncbi:MAG: UPF0175 family protein [Candidatus Baldrarchaeia archaeon]